MRFLSGCHTYRRPLLRSCCLFHIFFKNIIRLTHSPNESRAPFGGCEFSLIFNFFFKSRMFLDHPLWFLRSGNSVLEYIEEILNFENFTTFEIYSLQFIYNHTITTSSNRSSISATLTKLLTHLLKKIIQLINHITHIIHIIII